MGIGIKILMYLRRGLLYAMVLYLLAVVVWGLVEVLGIVVLVYCNLQARHR